MWTREELKTRSKNFLRKNYLQAFIVCLIVSLLTGNVYNRNTYKHELNYNYQYDNDRHLNPYERDADHHKFLNDKFDRGLRDFGMNNFPKILGVSIVPMLFLGFGILSFILGILIKIFITNILDVGQAKFFLNAIRGDVQVANMLKVFSQDNYLEIVKTQFKRDLFIFLWSLLFLIPGFIKYYEYRMISYILAENPDISSSEAFEMSKEMTYGHKLDMFILNLSFIGWYILGSLVLGIGHLFVNPYLETTYACLYDKLKSGSIGQIQE